MDALTDNFIPERFFDTPTTPFYYNMIDILDPESLFIFNYLDHIVIGVSILVYISYLIATRYFNKILSAKDKELFELVVPVMQLSCTVISLTVKNNVFERTSRIVLYQLLLVLYTCFIFNKFTKDWDYDKKVKTYFSTALVYLIYWYFCFTTKNYYLNLLSVIPTFIAFCTILDEIKANKEN